MRKALAEGHPRSSWRARRVPSFDIIILNVSPYKIAIARTGAGTQQTPVSC